MTNVTTFTPNPALFSYTGLPAGDLRANLPRAEVSFGVIGLTDNVTAGGVSDDQRIDVNCVLPLGYAYVLREGHFAFVGEDASEWEDTGFITWQDTTTAADRSTFVPMGIFSRGGGANGANSGRWKNWTIEDPIKQVVLPGVGNQGQLFHVSLLVPLPDKAAGTFHFEIRFLQYDIEQAHHYAVNNPLPVR